MPKIFKMGYTVALLGMLISAISVFIRGGIDTLPEWGMLTAAIGFFLISVFVVWSRKEG